MMFWIWKSCDWTPYQLHPILFRVFFISLKQSKIWIWNFVAHWKVTTKIWYVYLMEQKDYELFSTLYLKCLVNYKVQIHMVYSVRDTKVQSPIWILTRLQKCNYGNYSALYNIVCINPTEFQNYKINFREKCRHIIFKYPILNNSTIIGC
jgi:hypothetical protein